MSLQDFLAKMEKDPKTNLISKSFLTLKESATSKGVDLKLLPTPMVALIDQLAARVLDADLNKTIVVGFPSAGKSFIIEQLVFNIHRYLENSPLDELHFIVMNDMDMMEIGNTENLRSHFQTIKSELNAKDNSICFVTESVETALYISTALPKAKVILEVNTDVFFDLIATAARATSKTWASWQVVDVNNVYCTKRQLVGLLNSTIVARVNPETKYPLTKSQVNSFVNYFLKHMPELLMETQEGVFIAAPPGVWGTAIRYFMGALSYTFDPRLLTDDGKPVFPKILAKSFHEIEDLFKFYTPDDEKEIEFHKVPEEILRILGKEGHRVISVGGVNKSKDVSPLVFKDMNSLATRLKTKIMGQDEAINEVSSGLTVPAAGLNDENKPLRTFLFLGPTGVGKTQLAQDLAKEISTPEMNVVRIDMSEYQSDHEVSKLFGAPPGYVGFESGGRLTTAVMENPHSLIILDEVEKAHPKVWDVFLQVFDSGRMTDGQGQLVDFTQTIIIMTSNIGVKEANKNSIGFSSLSEEESYLFRQKNTALVVMKELEKSFRPEFINRIDEIIIFKELSSEVLGKILERELSLVSERVKARGFSLKKPSNEVMATLLEKSDISKYGAREIQRVVFKNVSSPVAKFMLKGAKTKTIELMSSKNGIIVVDGKE